jgi:hypothetical protein
MVTAPVMPMARGIQAAFTSDAPLLVNASSASDVTLAAMYQRKWCEDMQAPPFARREKAQETIARIVRPTSRPGSSRSTCRRLHRPDGDGGLGSAPHTAIKRSAAAFAAGERRPTPAGTRPPDESRQCAAGALFQTEHMHVVPRTTKRTRSGKRMPGVIR